MAQAMDRYVLIDPCPTQCPDQHLGNGSTGIGPGLFITVEQVFFCMIVAYIGL